MITKLPDGRSLSAKTQPDEQYPGIEVYVLDPNGNRHLVSITEFNPDQPPGQELSIAAYKKGHEEPAYYASYNHND